MSCTFRFGMESCIVESIPIVPSPSEFIGANMVQHAWFSLEVLGEGQGEGEFVLPQTLPDPLPTRSVMQGPRKRPQ